MHLREHTSLHRALGDPTRLRIVHLLLYGPLCVCHIQNILHLGQAKTSRHLAHLRLAGLVVRKKDANWRIYGLPSTPSPLVQTQLDALRQLAPQTPRLLQDLQKRHALHPTSCC